MSLFMHVQNTALYEDFTCCLSEVGNSSTCEGSMGGPLVSGWIVMRFGRNSTILK